jgi:hypothetical protein
VLRFRTQRTASRPRANTGQTVQRRSVWFVMAALLFVVLFGQSAYRKFRGPGPGPGPGDGHLTDNKIERPEQLIMPGQWNPPKPKPMLPVEGKRLFGGVSSTVFHNVEDDAGYRSAENDTFFTLMRAMQDADRRDVEAASIGRKTFVQLFEQANDYRGEIVTIGGTVMRLIPQTKPLENRHGVKKYYEVWLRPDGGNLPMVAVCLELPADYPASGSPQVDISGYFYKRFGYPSAEEAAGNHEETGTKNVYRSAPLVLAKTLTVRPTDVAAAAAEDEGPAFLAGVPLPIPSKYVLPLLGVGMIVTVALSAWAFGLMRTPVRRGPIVGGHRTDEPPVTNLNSLEVDT